MLYKREATAEENASLNASLNAFMRRELGKFVSDSDRVVWLENEVARVLEDIEAHDSQTLPEFGVLCDEICPTDTKREFLEQFLEQFMWRLCLPYVIG